MTRGVCLFVEKTKTANEKESFAVFSFSARGRRVLEEGSYQRNAELDVKLYLASNLS